MAAKRREDMTDRELLARVDERVEGLQGRVEKVEKCLTRHLGHHQAILLAIIGAVVTAIVACVFKLR